MRKITQPLLAWLRVVLPGYLANTFLVFLACFAMLFAFRCWVYDSEMLMSGSAVIGWGLALAGITAYAIFRAWYFHPLENEEYGYWLGTTPWKHPQKLPLGPLGFVLQDVFVVASLVAIVMGEYLVTDPGWISVKILAVVLVTVFLVVHALTVWVSAASRQEPIGGYGIAALFALGLHFWMWPVGCLLVAVAMSVVAHLSLHKVLRNFHFHIPGSYLRWQVRWLAREANLGWPAERLLSTEAGRIIPMRHTLLLAASLAWLVVSVVSSEAYFRQLDGEVVHLDKDIGTVLLFTIFPLIAFRLLIYSVYYASPISLLGRIFTRRLVIPKYDYVLIAPVLATLVAFYLPPTLIHIGCPSRLVLGISLFIVASIVLGMGPTLDSWKHTGHHRITARTMNKKTYSSTA